MYFSFSIFSNNLFVDSAANYLLEIFSFLTVPPEVFLSKDL